MCANWCPSIDVCNAATATAEATMCTCPGEEVWSSALSDYDEVGETGRVVTVSVSFYATECSGDATSTTYYGGEDAGEGACVVDVNDEGVA